MTTSAANSQVLPLGIDLRRFDQFRCAPESETPPLILWNHRWDFDKDPDAFVNSLLQLANLGYDFRVAITGQTFGQLPAAFERARDVLGNRLIQLGFVADFADYARLLWQADYVVSTAWQEFFGVSICEAIYCGCLPILPDRLNYPHLITDDLKHDCLYQRDRLTAQLRYHLDGDIQLDTSALREKIAQFDWRSMAPRYDNELSALANYHRRRLGRSHLS